MIIEKNQMIAREILGRDYQLHMNLIEAFREDASTDEEILELMKA